jgi:hypothetical protein
MNNRSNPGTFAAVFGGVCCLFGVALPRDPLEINPVNGTE